MLQHGMGQAVLVEDVLHVLGADVPHGHAVEGGHFLYAAIMQFWKLVFASGAVRGTFYFQWYQEANTSLNSFFRSFGS